MSLGFKPGPTSHSVFPVAWNGSLLLVLLAVTPAVFAPNNRAKAMIRKSALPLLDNRARLSFE